MTDRKMIRIEGKEFEHIKALKQRQEALEQASNDAERDMWDAITKVTGIGQSPMLCLDTEYEPLGFYVAKQEKRRSVLGDLLEKVAEQNRDAAKGQAGAGDCNIDCNLSPDRAYAVASANDAGPIQHPYKNTKTN